MSDGSWMDNRVFSYRVIRGIVGLIAVLIAIVTATFADVLLRSISASYHTDGQDFFVGSLFVVAAFLAAYRGHPRSPHEFPVAKLAAFFCLCVALFPTSDCPADFVCSAPAYLGLTLDTTGSIHSSTAVLFFIGLIVLMFSFAHRAWTIESRPLGALVYATCGAVMVIAFVVYAIARWAHEPGTTHGLLFYAEHVALTAFGIGWLFSGVYLWVESKWGWSWCPAWLSGMHRRYQSN